MLWSVTTPPHRRGCVASPGLLGAAGEILGVVGAAHALVDRDLRIRAERTAHVHAIAGQTRRVDAIRRRVALAPALERRHPVDLIRPLPAAAVTHPRHHEQPDEVVLLATHLLLHAGVV